METKSYLEKFMAFALPLMVSVGAQAFEYRINASLSSQERVAVQAMLKKADSMLPETLKSALSTVDVRFSRLPANPGATNIAASNRSRMDLTLDTGILSEIVKGPEASTPTKGRTHKSMYAETLAAVLHETTHLYDFANVHSDLEKDWIDRCDTKFAKSKDERIRNGSRQHMCRFYGNMTTSFSHNPYFLQVAGWADNSENAMNQRSPDVYELTSPLEYLAVNMEYFLMDPQYKCRRPGMYNILSRQFRHVPFENVTCERHLGYVVPNHAQQYATLANIDPSRVYQVHYLYAEKGDAIDEGWGHAMIRLVICAPNRVVGPDCLKDVDQHLVLSYRAFIEAVQMSAWAGLVGDYPLRMFILPMQQVIDEYPRDQFRALRSIPLNLNRQQIRDFVTRSVEIHWSFETRYKFITSNCATETLNLLQAVLLSPELMNTEVKTPKGLYDVLLKQGLMDDRVLADRKQALSNGFYFDSYGERYQTTFDIIKDAGLLGANGPKDYKEWIASASQYRANVIQSIRKSEPNYKKIVASIFVLELAAQRSLQTYVINLLTAEVMDAQKNRSNQVGRKASENWLELSKLFAKPSTFLVEGTGYGLPDSSEMNSAQEMVVKKAKVAEQIAKESKSMSDSMKDKDGALVKEIETSNENIKTLQKLLRGKQ